jgi:hypothetical protein
VEFSLLEPFANITTPSARAKLSRPSAETTDVYVTAELVMKKFALARLHEPEAKLRRDRPPGSMIDFLRTLKLCGVRNRRLPLHTSSGRRKPTVAPHNRDIYIIGLCGHWSCEPRMHSSLGYKSPAQFERDCDTQPIKAANDSPTSTPTKDSQSARLTKRAA